MSGVAVIRYLLVHDAAVLAKVPASRIFAGDAPIKTELPALSVKQISGLPYLTVAMDENARLHTERVQVTALVKSSDGTPAGEGYPGVKALLAIVFSACKNTHGTVDGVDVVSVLPDTEGPDLEDAVHALLTQSRDFMVRYNA